MGTVYFKMTRDNIVCECGDFERALTGLVAEDVRKDIWDHAKSHDPGAPDVTIAVIDGDDLEAQYIKREMES